MEPVTDQTLRPSGPRPGRRTPALLRNLCGLDRLSLQADFACVEEAHSRAIDTDLLCSMDAPGHMRLWNHSEVPAAGRLQTLVWKAVAQLGSLLREAVATRRVSRSVLAHPGG